MPFHAWPNSRMRAPFRRTPDHDHPADIVGRTVTADPHGATAAEELTRL